MTGLKVAVVTHDEAMKLEVARAFDSAPASWAITLHDSPPGDADVLVFGPDVQAGGGIVFDPLQPSAVVQSVAAQAERSRSTAIVVTSASGGTGVTTLALHLAAATAEWSKTCFVDADVLSGAALRLHLEESSHRTWADLEGDEDVLKTALPLPHGFRALFAPQSWAGDPFGHAVTRAQARFETVVIDAPFSCPWPLVPEGAATGVLVMSPTLPSAHRTRAFLDEHCSTMWAVVCNRLGPGGEMTRTELERIVEHRIGLELPCTPALRDAEDEGKLLGLRVSRYSRRVVQLARALRSP